MATGIDNTLARSLHDVGLGAWFGGSLMGAVGLNGAATAVDDPTQRLRVANAGWARWTPVNLVGIAVHLVGGAQILASNKGRIAAQQGVATSTGVKLGLTAAALAATGYSRLVARRLEKAGDVPVTGGTTPAADTPPDVRSAQRQLTVLQWVIPALTGSMLVLTARQGEEQRPAMVATGIFKRLWPAA